MGCCKILLSFTLMYRGEIIEVNELKEINGYEVNTHYSFNAIISTYEMEIQ